MLSEQPKVAAAGGRSGAATLPVCRRLGYVGLFLTCRSVRRPVPPHVGVRRSAFVLAVLSSYDTCPAGSPPPAA